MLPLCGVEGDKQEQRDNEGEGYSAPSPAPQLTVTPEQQQCRSENDEQRSKVQGVVVAAQSLHHSGDTHTESVSRAPLAPKPDEKEQQ